VKDKERSAFLVRALVIFWAFFFFAAMLAARLFIVQIHQGAGLAANAGEEHLAQFPLSARRGDIVDRFGNVFSTSLPSSAIFAQPAGVTEPAVESKRLAAILRMNAGALQRLLSSKTTFVYVARNVPQAVAARIDALALPGIGTSDEPMGIRVQPQSRAASTVVGFTGVDNQGLSGLEYRFNELLSGKPGKVIQATDAARRPIPFGRRTVQPSQAGASLVLTIDRSLQFAADEVLRSTVARFHAADGSIIIMRARTGEVMALANWPDFDPNRYAASPSAAWKNQAVTDPYEPGSTFKLITAAAALDSGKVSLADTFPARDSIEVGNRIIHNADDGLMASGHASETLDDIVTFSHNVGAAQVALRVGKRTMYEYIRRFDFDRETRIDLPGESAGIVGTPDDWWGSRLATIGFGQGISVTPLALARAYCSIANGGLLMRPLIVRYVVAPDGHVLRRYDPQTVRRAISSQTSAALLAMLRDVMKRGTGKGITMPGYALAGKTGTAQMVIDGAYAGGAYTASFVGIVPADKPQYVILVKIDRPRGAYYGSIVAAPAFQTLAGTVMWREGVTPRHADEAFGAPAAAANTAAGEATGKPRTQP